MKKKLLIGLALITTAIVAYAATMTVTLRQGAHDYNTYWKKLPSEEKRVALTFDDGPNSGDTEKLLDLLDQLNVKATFFLNGKHVIQHPELIQEMHKRGHGIGNHSWSHKMLAHLGKSTPLQELKTTNDAIKNILGFEPTLFRAPFLVQGRGLGLAVQELGMQSVGGIGTNDWEELNPENIASAIVEAVEPGAIIVLHDGDASSTEEKPQDSRTPTVNAVKVIIHQLRSQGYRFTHPDELLELSPAP